MQINPKAKAYCYPNPSGTSSTLYINSISDEKIKLKLYNATGLLISVIYEGAINLGNNSLPFSTFAIASGLYFINIEGLNINERIKFIKQ